MSETAVTIAEPLASEVLPPRPRGRPPGSGNRSLVTEKRIMQHNRARSFCAKVVGGGRIKAAGQTGGKERVWCFPTIKERLKAAEILSRDASMLEAAQNGLVVGQAMIVNIQIVAPGASA